MENRKKMQSDKHHKRREMSKRISKSIKTDNLKYTTDVFNQIKRQKWNYQRRIIK